MPNKPAPSDYQVIPAHPRGPMIGSRPLFDPPTGRDIPSNASPMPDNECQRPDVLPYSPSGIAKPSVLPRVLGVVSGVLMMLQVPWIFAIALSEAMGSSSPKSAGTETFFTDIEVFLLYLWPTIIGGFCGWKSVKVWGWSVRRNFWGTVGFALSIISVSVVIICATYGIYMSLTHK